MCIDHLTIQTYQHSETMKFHLLKPLCKVHTKTPRKRFFRDGINFELKGFGNLYLRQNSTRAEIEFNPNKFITWDSCLRLLGLLNVDLELARITKIHFNIDLKGIEPEAFRRELAPLRTRKHFIVRELIHMKDGKITEKLFDWSNPILEGLGWTSATQNSGSASFKQIAVYDAARKHKLGPSPVTRIEVRYNSPSVLTKTVKLGELSTYMRETRPFRSVRLYRETKSLPPKGQDRIKFELFRRLRNELGHKGALQALRDFDQKPLRTFRKTIGAYRQRRIDLDRIYEKRKIHFFRSSAPKRVELLLLKIAKNDI